MNDDRDFLRATTEWLEAGSDRTPPKAIDGVLLAVRTTRQDRVLPTPWRYTDMNGLAKALVAAMAVVVIALALINIRPSTNNVGIAPPTPTPSPTPTSSPTPTLVVPLSDTRALEPGHRYAFPSRATDPAISFIAPSGWTGNGSLVMKFYGDLRPGPALSPWPFDHGFKEPCTDHTPVVPAAGSGAAGLLGVIARQPGLDAGPVRDVTVGGHDGKYVDYTITVDPATCGNGEDGFWIWGSCPAPVTLGCEMVGGGDRRWQVSHNDRERAYAIDVDGKTVTFFTNQPPYFTTTDGPELQQVLDSIEFEPAG